MMISLPVAVVVVVAPVTPVAVVVHLMATALLVVAALERSKKPRTRNRTPGVVTTMPTMMQLMQLKKKGSRKLQLHQLQL